MNVCFKFEKKKRDGIGRTWKITNISSATNNFVRGFLRLFNNNLFF